MIEITWDLENKDECVSDTVELSFVSVNDLNMLLWLSDEINDQCPRISSRVRVKSGL